MVFGSIFNQYTRKGLSGETNFWSIIPSGFYTLLEKVIIRTQQTKAQFNKFLAASLHLRVTQANGEQSISG